MDGAVVVVERIVETLGSWVGSGLRRSWEAKEWKSVLSYTWGVHGESRIPNVKIGIYSVRCAFSG